MLRDHVVDEVGSRLGKLGFRKRGNTWRRETDHGIEVFNIQGSRWGGGAFYLNVGIYLGDDRDLREPKEHECQICGRIEHQDRSGEEVFAEAREWFERQGRRSNGRVRPSGDHAAPVRVRHAKFGEGTVVSRRDDTFEIRFDDGTTRRLKQPFVESLQTTD